MTREALDVYETPIELACEIINNITQYLNLHETPVILEPSCGSGAFIKACKRKWPNSHIHGIDVRPLGFEALQAGASAWTQIEWEKFIYYETYGENDIDLILGNPPYSLAQKHIELALDRVKKGGYVAFLLRINFLASRKRFEFFNKNPLFALFPICGRPSFKNGTTDQTEYGMFVWYKDTHGVVRSACPGEVKLHHIWSPNGRSKNSK